jgi:hypothetical protein
MPLVALLGENPSDGRRGGGPQRVERWPTLGDLAAADAFGDPEPLS